MWPKIAPAQLSSFVIFRKLKKSTLMGLKSSFFNKFVPLLIVLIAVYTTHTILVLYLRLILVNSYA